MNVIGLIREKLDVYWEPFVKKDFLLKILEKFASNYSIEDLCAKGLVLPIKKGKRYINTKSKKFINPFIVGALYMGEDISLFGWLGIYNKWWLSEQVAEWYTIYNTKLSWKKVIWPCKFIFVRQRESFFYGMEQIKIDTYTYTIMSKERAFIQLLKENKKFDTLPSWINKNALLTLAQKHASKHLFSKIVSLCS